MASLDKLQNPKQRKVLDIVSKLRENGLSNFLELPQLVVCGDQSSGKSSVLEAISELPFPRKEGLCTRFATEVLLRFDPKPSITATIVPDSKSSKNKPHLQEMRDLNGKIDAFPDFPALFDRATKCMGLGDAGKSSPRAFTTDILKVKISGPRMPDL